MAAGLIAAPLPVLTTFAVAPTEPAKKATKEAKPKKQPAPDMVAIVAMREVQKKCGAEWEEAKANGKVEKGMKWPLFCSACNKRLGG
jgi:hypothetical protein